MNGIIQCSCLGSFGRFGNQLFQYAFARAYAEACGCRLETSGWIGQEIFEGINDPPPSEVLPKTELDGVKFGTVNIDLFGYFQHKRFLEWYSVAFAKRIFSLKAPFRTLIERPSADYIAVHLRRGDYERLGHLYCLISKESYLHFLRQIGAEDKRIVWVSEELPHLVESLAPKFSFIPDFLLMMNANILLRANSTFSWWAGTLSSGLVFSPIVGDKVGENEVQFVQGNASKIFWQEGHSELILKER